VLDPTQLAILGRVGVCVMLGGASGLERDLPEKTAALRKHVVVAGTSVLPAPLGEVLPDRAAQQTESRLLGSYLSAL
jgi:uncharacterized membrane protein YhiD involved in acid resistance